jgi:hypothetical protein
VSGVLVPDEDIEDVMEKTEKPIVENKEEMHLEGIMIISEVEFVKRRDRFI